ncbi:MAG TPA: hypothetical protein VIY54_09990 [Steroidobacteraceae bacterium]
MSASARELRLRNLRTLALLAGLFLVPLALSFWMYYGTSWRPATLVSHGELIRPVHELPAASLPAAVPGMGAPVALFRHKWSLVYIGSGTCNEACRQTLYVMRQSRLALNTGMTRVERVFLVTGNCCDRELLQREHPGMFVVDATGTAGRKLLELFPADRANALFIVDPLGNLMMRYDARRNPKGLLEDLKKLLALSHIG